MGMYTEMALGLTLVDVPSHVLLALESMVSGRKSPEGLPDHEFFLCDRWRMLFCGSSAYFMGGSTCSLANDLVNGNEWHLSFRANIKNYDCEQEKFLDFISPYVEKAEVDDEFVGFQRYESDVNPKLIFLCVEGGFRVESRYLPPKRDA